MHGSTAPLLVGELQISKLPSTDEEIGQLSVALSRKLAEKLPTEEDVWWFLMEQHDRAQSYAHSVKPFLARLPFELQPIEYEGRRSETSYVGKPNPGIAYLDSAVDPFFRNNYSENMAQLVRVSIYVTYCHALADTIQAIRLKYAVHFHNNCISTKSFGYAEQWNEVIQQLGGA